MRNLIKIVTLLTLVAGCRPLAVVRDPSVYENEVDYNTMVNKQSTELLRSWLTQHCSCTDSLSWSFKGSEEPSEQCEQTAKYILVVETRGPWHAAMMMYNGGLTEERPSEDPPQIPPPSALCKSEV